MAKTTIIQRHRLVSRLESRLRFEIQSYLNYTLIPALRAKREVNPKRFSDLILSYSTAFYGLGAHYVTEIANNELKSSSKDYDITSQLNKDFTLGFWSKINGYSSIQRVQPNLRPSQVISMEKDKISSELSTLVAWKSYNAGVRSKGQELQNDLKQLKRSGLVGVTRTVWNKDFTGIYRHKIITDRVSNPKPNPERTSQTEEEAAMSFVFITQQDELVCPICRDLELRAWTLADPDMPTLPDDTHPNCRCFLMLAESEEETELRLTKKELLDLGLSATDIAAIGATIVGTITGKELREELEKIRKKRKKESEKRLRAIEEERKKKRRSR